jgi:large subunit ribosomal protein L17
MRHRVAQRKLGRVTEHRIAMLRNQAERLIQFEHIETTVPKAKELRPFVERIITIAKRGLAKGDGNGGALHARRLVLRDIQNRDVVSKLFETIAPRFETRPGGYTRILRMNPRPGDSAPMALMQLVDGPVPVAAEAPTEDKKAARGKTAAKSKAKGKSKVKAEAAEAPAEAPKKRTRKKKTAA